MTILRKDPSARAFNNASGAVYAKSPGTEDVACVIDAKHLCVNSRGIKDIESSTVTAEFGGKFKDPLTKQEFLDYLKMDTDFQSL